MNGGFTNFCGKYMAFDTDKIANVQQLFKDRVVHGFVFVRANFIAIEVELNSTTTILQLGKGSFAHESSAH